MIDKKCFTTEWIAQKASELQFNDKNLIEKAIRAFSLLDLLAASGCPFHFKGGSSLMLLLQGERHRLSIDIDIVCPPNVNVEDYLNEYSESGFLEYELVERKQSISKVPKSHRKFFYQVAYQANSTQKQYILLDVLYEDCHYIATQKMPISSDLIACVGATTMVNVPSISDILGDKLTAFAPDTIGVPYYKHEKVASNKINKLRVNNPEAFFYWAKVGELLDGKTI